VTILPEQEILAAALWVERSQGENGPRFIAEQIGALALQGDEPGIERWKAIAAAWQQLQAGPVQ
jgi:hypothetical protein